MVRIVTGMLVMLGAAGLVYGQEGDKKPAPKGDGFKEGVKEGGDKGPGPQLLVSEVDTNGDGWITAAELKMALSKMGGGGGTKDGAKKPGGLKDGEGKKVPAEKGDGFKEGDFKKPAPKPDGFKGDAPKKDAPKEGDKEGGDKKGEK